MNQAPVEEVPLIWTTHGNLPVSSLAYRTEWDMQDSYVKLTERYSIGEEVVRESVHVFDKIGISGDSTVAAMG